MGIKLERLQMFSYILGRCTLIDVHVHTVHLLEGPLEVTGDDILASYVQVGRPDAT